MSQHSTLTTCRIMREQGILGRQLVELALAEVQDVILRQDIIGRIFGYGTISIESAGVQGQVQWIGIAAPLRVRRPAQTVQNFAFVVEHDDPGVQVGNTKLLA